MSEEKGKLFSDIQNLLSVLSSLVKHISVYQKHCKVFLCLSITTQSCITRFCVAHASCTTYAYCFQEQGLQHSERNHVWLEHFQPFLQDLELLLQAHADFRQQQQQKQGPRFLHQPTGSTSSSSSSQISSFASRADRHGVSVGTFEQESPAHIIQPHIAWGDISPYLLHFVRSELLSCCKAAGLQAMLLLLQSFVLPECKH